MKYNLHTFKTITFGVILFTSFTLASAQAPKKNHNHKKPVAKSHAAKKKVVSKPKLFNWKTLENGLYYTQIQAPRMTKIGDYKIDVLKVDPKIFDFELNSYVMHDTIELTAPEWSEKFGYLAVINAGMYSYSSPLLPVGYMKSKHNLVNPRIKSSYNSAFVFGGLDNIAKVTDLENLDDSLLYDEYSSALQSIRMINKKGEPVTWLSRKYMRCSMGIIGQDKDGFIYLIFIRSPLKPNEMSIFLSKQPLNLVGLMYLEGGPETSYVINHPNLKIEKMGCYVSRTWPRNNCTELRKIPQVIGVKRK